jgi:uncharacterized Rmd1/YagE family protein
MSNYKIICQWCRQEVEVYLHVDGGNALCEDCAWKLYKKLKNFFEKGEAVITCRWCNNELSPHDIIELNNGAIVCYGCYRELKAQILQDISSSSQNIANE